MINYVKMDVFRWRKSVSSWVLLLCQLLNIILLNYFFADTTGAFACFEISISGLNTLIIITIQGIVFWNHKYNDPFLKNIINGSRRDIVLADFIEIIGIVALYFAVSLVITFGFAFQRGFDQSVGDVFLYAMVEILCFVAYLLAMEFLCLVIKNKSFALLVGLLYTLIISLVIWSYLSSKLPFDLTKLVVSQYIMTYEIGKITENAGSGVAVSIVTLVIALMINIKLMEKREL